MTTPDLQTVAWLWPGIGRRLKFDAPCGGHDPAWTPLVRRSDALARIEALERERDEWRESCAQAAREVNALREMLRDAIRWHAVQHVFHVERAARDQVMLSAHWSAWVNGQHHTVTDAVDAYAAQNAGAKP